MVPPIVFALAFTLPIITTCEEPCAPSDTQCLAGMDLNSMIQFNAKHTVIPVTPKATNDGSVATVDVGQPESAKGANAAADPVKEFESYMSGPLAVLSQDKWKTRTMYACFSWAIYVMLAMLIWAVCYPGSPVKVAAPDDVEDPKMTLETGHFQCFRSPEICLCACLCPGLRWADTMSLIQLVRITVGLSLVFLCALFNGLTYGNAMIGPFTLLLALYYRHRLRAMFGLNHFTCGSCCVDALYILFCPWCAISQEARAVTHYLQKGLSTAP